MIMKKYIIALPVLITLLIGCSKETALDDGPVKGERVDALLTLQVPAGGFRPAATRALGSGDENTIREVDVLVFSKQSAGAADNTAVFFHRAQTTSVSDAGTDNNGNARRSFRISVQKSSKPLQLVVLANCRELVDDLIDGFTAGTTLRSDALDALVMESASAWNSTDDTYDPLPMWGQTAFRTITDAASAAATIDMIRAQARIDVTVNESAKGDFSLTNVRLYKPSTQGLISPPSWTSGEVSLPASRDAAASPFLYDELTTAGEALVGVIYTFEAPAAMGNTDANAPFLVVGGSWNGESESYYRIDFAKTENNATVSMPLLRNYHYEVDITSVAGRGYPSPDVAAANGFTGLTAKVHQWAQGQMGTVVWDGQNWLAVSDTRFSLYPEERSGLAIQVATTFLSGWRATVALDEDDEADWLTISGSDTGAGNAANPPIGTLSFEVTENLTSTPSRTAVITIAAGRLQQTVTVVQSITKELALEVGEVQMIFSAASPTATPLRVEWTPGTIPCAVTPSNAPNGVDGTVYSMLQFSTPLQPVTDPLQEGEVNYSITPDVFTVSASNPFEERRTTLTITANDGASPTPNAVSKTILLRQFDYAIRITGEQASYQQYASYSLTVRSNDEWEMEVEDDDDIIMTITTPVGEPNITAAGETVTFTMAGPDKAGKSATLTFKSKTGNFADEPITITMQNNEPNCYIVPPVAGRNSVTIPISKVFRLWREDVDLNGTRSGDVSAMTSSSGYSAELLWQDEQGLITSSSFALTSQDALGTFTVAVNSGVGAREGNAVVVLKENGTIRWSWHIWVCDFDPDQNTGYNSRNGLVIMDRDLGAVNTTYGDIGSYGMYYQWGRPTPFPKAAGTSTSVFKTIYNSSGSPLNVSYQDMATFAGNLNYRNLSNALSDPLTFYWSSRSTAATTDDYDWYSPTVVGDASVFRLPFWGTHKSDYDPCPDGWHIPEKLILDYVPQTWSFTAGAGQILYDIQNNLLGLFSASGYITAERAYGLRNVGNYSMTWKAGAGSGTSCSSTYINSSSIYSSSATCRARGICARCVKIQ